MRHAETYYWLGMAEGGNLQAFNKGLGYLKLAREALLAANLEDARLDVVKPGIDALEQDLLAQADLAHDTLQGVFPLLMTTQVLRLINGIGFTTFEVVDDPAVMAITDAASKLAIEVIEKWPYRPQFDVVFTSNPVRSDLENEALYIFNASSKFFVHNAREVVDVLGAESADTLGKGELSRASRDMLQKSFGVDRLLQVHISEQDVVDDVYFYTVQGRLFTRSLEAPETTISVMGFSRDRRAVVLPAAIVAAALGLLAVLLFRFNSPEQTRLGNFVAPFVAFTLGLFLPGVLLILLAPIRPPPETLAWLGFWWPLLAGAGLFLVPMMFWRMARARLAGMGLLRNAGWAGYVAVVLGVSGYLSLSMFALSGEAAIVDVSLMVIAATISAWLAARALETTDRLPQHAFAMAVLLLGFTGLAVFAVDRLLLAVAAGMSILAAASYYALVDRRGQGSLARESTTQVSPDIPRGASSELCKSARFFETNLLREIQNKLPHPPSRLASWVVLSGKHGSGKTETAKALIRDLRDNTHAVDGDLQVLAGRCQHGTPVSEAFGPFRQALRHVINADSLATESTQGDGLDSALFGLVDTLVPFSNLFLSSERSATTGGLKEVHDSVAQALKKLAKSRMTILFIEDAQWIDQASKDLLDFLVEAIPADSNFRFMGIVCSTTEQPFRSRLWERALITVPDLGDAQQKQILIKNFGIEPNTATSMVERMVFDDHEYASFYWLLQTVDYYAEKKLFRSTPAGLVLTAEARHAPVSGLKDLRQYIASKLPETQDDRHVLIMASCLGALFKIDVLAGALGVNRLTVLRQLESIVSSSNLLRESSTQAGFYEFTSPQVWEVACETYGIDALYRGLSTTAMLVREYHACLAATLAKLSDSNPSLLAKSAAQYFAAGNDYALQATDLCIKAARSETARFNFSGAVSLLEKAATRAARLGREKEVEWERLRTRSQQVHLQGVSATEKESMALDLLAYVRRHMPTDSAAMLLTVRAFYDAGQYQGVIRLASDTLQVEPESPLVRAEALQFLGLAQQRTRIVGAEEHLLQAYALLDDRAPSSTNLDTERLRAKIADALAGSLAYSKDAEQRRQARAFYQISLSIKERPEIQDLRGQAMTHGGVGRQALFGDPPDYETARFHLTKDLRLSEQLGDLHGQSMMHTLLGDCDLAEGKPEAALAHYGHANEAAQDNAANQRFATVGVIRSAYALGKSDLVETHGKRLAELLSQFAMNRLEANYLLEKLLDMQELVDTAWLREVKSMLDPERYKTPAIVSRKFSYRFVPKGALAPIPLPVGEVWLDVGNRIDDCVIDHHQGTEAGESTTELVFAQGRRLIQKPLTGVEMVTFVLHEEPDLDAVTAAWLARRLLIEVPTEASEMSWRQIVSAVSHHDQGFFESIPLGEIWSLMMTLRLAECATGEQHIKIGFELLDRTLAQLERAELLTDISRDLSTAAIKERLITSERAYACDITGSEIRELALPCVTEASGNIENPNNLQATQKEKFKRVDALFVRDPLTPMIREMARSDKANSPHGDGFGLLVVSYRVGELNNPARYRHIISVKPNLGVNLAGLGARIEGMEKNKEETAGLTLVKGRERLAKGEGRHGYGVKSPWYDGRGHHYTIIDSPNVEVDGKEMTASVLTPEEILEAITQYAENVGEGVSNQHV